MGKETDIIDPLENVQVGTGVYSNRVKGYSNTKETRSKEKHSKESFCPSCSEPRKKAVSRGSSVWWCEKCAEALPLFEVE